MRARRTRTMWAALLALGAVAIVAQVGSASAAQLPLEGPMRPSQHTAERCADQVSAVITGKTSTTVTVDDIPAECAGLPVSAAAYTNAFRPLSTPVTVPSAGGPVNVSVSSFTPTAGHKAYVTIGDWPIPAPLTYETLFCQVVDEDDHPIAGRSCSVEGITVATGTKRWLFIFTDDFATFTIQTDHDAEDDEYVRVTADLSAASGEPSWVATSANRGTSPSDSFSDYEGLACSDLPWFSARSHAGPEQEFTQQVRRNRAALAWVDEDGATCS